MKWVFVHKNVYTCAPLFSWQEGELTEKASSHHLGYSAQSLSIPSSELSLSQTLSGFKSTYFIGVQHLYSIKCCGVMYGFILQEIVLNSGYMLLILIIFTGLFHRSHNFIHLTVTLFPFIIFFSSLSLPSEWKPVFEFKVLRNKFIQITVE